MHLITPTINIACRFLAVGCALLAIVTLVRFIQWAPTLTMSLEHLREIGFTSAYAGHFYVYTRSLGAFVACSLVLFVRPDALGLLIITALSLVRLLTESIFVSRLPLGIYSASMLVFYEHMLVMRGVPLDGAFLKVMETAPHSIQILPLHVAIKTWGAMPHEDCVRRIRQGKFSSAGWSVIMTFTTAAVWWLTS